MAVQNTIRQSTYANLPAASLESGLAWLITDANALNPTSGGNPGNLIWVYSNGSAWVNFPAASVGTQTANFSISASPNPQTFLIDCTGGSVAATLPISSPYVGQQIEVKRKDSVTTNQASILGTVNIDQNPILYLTAQNQSAVIRWDGTQWWTVSGYSGTFSPAAASGPFWNVSPITLKNFRAALAGLKQGSADCKVMCCGDSITFGINSAITLAAYAQGWPARLAALFNQSSLTPSQQGMAVPSLSAISITGGVLTNIADDRWGASGSWANTSQSYGCAAYAVAYVLPGWSGSSGTLTFNPSSTAAVNCDTFDVYYLISANGGTLNLTASGGSPVTQSCLGSAGMGVVSVAAASAATSNTLSITSTDNTKPVWVVGIVPRLSTKSQLLFANCGIPGQTSLSWAVGATNPAASNFVGAHLAGVYSPSLITLLLGTNDAGASISPATFLSQMQTVIQAFKTFAPNTDLMLLTPPPTATSSQNVVIASYLPLYYQLAAQFGASVFDIWQRYNGTFNATLENGVHPNSLGYWDIAGSLFEVLAHP